VENSGPDNEQDSSSHCKIHQPQAQNTTASSSGFVHDKQGHIITNSHVVENAKIVDVIFVDGYSYAAKVIGTDIYTDIAE
jgi:S1-C subfamily serine protease